MEVTEQKPAEEAKTVLDPYKSLATQCKVEFELAWKHQKPKKDEAMVRLKLYNNQKRDKDAVGDTTLFTILQTVVASLYVDKLSVDFAGKEDGDEETADNLNALAESDYSDMEKDSLDYDWVWDTAFFGRGLMLVEEFDRDPDNNVFIPCPEILDPITFLRDPDAVSVNGNGRKRKNAMRFGGWECKMGEDEMKEHPSFLKESLDFTKIDFGSTTMSLLQDAATARNEAQNRQDTAKFDKEEKLGANAKYDITVWFTHCRVGDDGLPATDKTGKIKKVKVWLANERTKVVGFKVLKHDYFPIVDRALYPTSHDWDGTSIADLTEDKQRAKAMAQNLGLQLMRADLEPMYIYDSNRITNKNDLNFEFNKFIPIDAKDRPVGDAIIPLTKVRPNMPILDFIFNSLDVSAQKATATPEMQQGQMSVQQRTLGELNLIASKVDTRYSLSAKIFGWSEKRFWKQWYQLYKDNFADDIDEKVLRIVGAFGAKWRPLKKDNIIARLDPDITIESLVLSRAKQLEDRQALTQYFSLALQDPTSNRRWGLKKLAGLNGLTKSEIERLFPPTIDERVAEEQNELLNVDKLAPVLPEDDHNVHLEVHSKANETSATTVHIKTHQKALMVKKVKPELFPEDASAAQFQPEGTGKVLPVPTPEKLAVNASQTSNQPARTR